MHVCFSGLLQHLDDILALKPDCVWLQSGIRCAASACWCIFGCVLLCQRMVTAMQLVTDCPTRYCCSNPEFEQAVAAAGITVVPSRCLKVDRAAAAGRSAL